MQIEHSPELERLTYEMYDAWARADATWFSDHLSPQDPIMLGSAPDDEIRGSDAINEVMGKAMTQLGSAPFKPSDRRILDSREHGEIGWTLAETKWEFEDESYVPVRGLTIWHREDGEWKVVIGLVAPAFSDDLLYAGSPVTRPAKAVVST